MRHYFTYKKAQTLDELQQIEALQAINHSATVSPEIAHTQGFVTVRHDVELLKLMNDAAGHIIAKDGDKLIGYALTMMPSFRKMIPVLMPLFDRIDNIEVDGKKLTDCAYYVMGQVCVAEAYRSKGVFAQLYQAHKIIFGKKYDYIVTSIATRNTRSVRAHEKVGFRTILSFTDATDDWIVVLMELK